MKINRKLYLRPFTKQSFSLTCSFCKAGTLSFIEETFKEMDTEESKDCRDTGDWEPAWINYLFTSFLKCSNKSCSEIATVTGNAGVKEYSNSDGSDPEYITEYNIEYVNPAINIIHIPDEVPKSIKEMLVSSFSLFWCDVPSSGNKIRKVIELVLDEKNVIPENLTLHKRIEKFGGIEDESYKNLSDMLMGVKWLANESSHKNESLTREDLLDAYEILDYVLTDLFVRDQQKFEIESKANKLTEKYSPKSI